uniref:Uncharacterized protein n=1 Tax=Oryza sativa subsp. japonica TaxID=39947 RepID=Q6Z452_ORYSJ|nr:hypothetical protein [Oryza sativa Japonica Group]BAD30853.1 hypothetical protein [Oryza sativa Japonica Group]
MDEVGGRWTFSRANEGYTSCGPVVEMSWHRAEEDVANCSPKVRKTAGSASEVEEAVKPAVKE